MILSKLPGLSWPRYTRLLGSGEPSADTSPTWTGLANAAASKRYRWIASTLALCLLLTLFYTNYDSLVVPQRQQEIPGLPESPQPPGEVPGADGAADWSRFAYTQYVTNSEYLCNSVMFFASLDRLGSRADRVAMYPSRMLEAGNEDTHDARLLAKARDEYGVKLVPIDVQHRKGQDSTWADSFTKLLAFNQTQYDRVLSIDSDVLLLQHMDELFLIPPVPVAMPRAYWLWPDEQILSSQVILLEPSELEFGRIMVKVQEADRNDYDMEIVNYLYRDSALVLPHRPYDLVTGEFRADDHKYYLGSDVEPWDPAAAYNEAKLVHFSDWPLPKPWLHLSEPTMMEMQPKCVDAADGSEDCTGRLIWNGFYSDFRKLRNDVCESVQKHKRHR